jgi:hypothetical protein
MCLMQFGTLSTRALASPHDRRGAAADFAS